MNQNPPPLPELTDEYLNRFIVVPEYKLLFCYVEKVGCTMFNNLFRKLRASHPHISVQEKEFLAERLWFRNSPAVHQLTKQDLQKLMVNRDWTKAMFYRDPVSRFLSAFKSKCEIGHDSDGNFFCNNAFGEERIKFTEALNKLKSGDTLSRVLADRHFTPMSNFCGGLDHTLDYYDVVHELEEETSAEKISNLFAKIGVDETLTMKLLDEIIVVPRSKNRRHNTKAEKKICNYIDTPNKLRVIEDTYAKDYQLFNLEPRTITCNSTKIGTKTRPTTAMT